MDNVNSSNPFRQIEVTGGFYHGRVITWKLDPLYQFEAVPLFTLQVSETPDFSELIYSKEGGDTYYILDDFKGSLNVPQSYLYRVRLVDGSKTWYSRTATHDFDTKSITRHKYLHARELVRLELKRMQYTGREAWLLKHKVYTVPDPSAVDPVSGVVITDEASSFGTGKLGGYYQPIKIRLTREDHADNIELNPDGSGTSQKKPARFRMAGFPLIGTRDVIVLNNDERYIASSILDRTYPGTDIVVVQNVDVKGIPVTDPVYQIDIPHE